MTNAYLIRQPIQVDGDDVVRIGNEYCEPDGLTIDMGPVTGAWWEVPLPACPDCGGGLVWWEAGNVPGTRKCAGQPIDAPTSIMDARVPQPGQYPPAVADQVEALTRERNTCPDERVEAIDREILAILKPYCHGILYDPDGGCGSLFSVKTTAERYVRTAKGQAALHLADDGE